MKQKIELFGMESGLFDELSINIVELASQPFQVQVKKGSPGKAGVWRNLTDMGYGLSQVLPLTLLSHKLSRERELKLPLI
ncbi:MAG: hypothetical protein OXL38_19095, partial [Gammaproteobacteria bacterium]|nr:hypothetical protein [Gammaproteobacteria bacterium]